MKQFKNQRGLTLIELLAVIVILAIIAAAAAVAIGNVIQNSKDKAILADASLIIDGAKIANLDGECSVTKGEGTCSKDELKPFVDLTTDKWDKFKGVAIAQDGDTGVVTYTIEYDLLSEIKNKKYIPDGLKDNKATAEAIVNAMNGNKKAATGSNG